MRKIIGLSLVLATAALAGCNSTATNNANIRGTNTNTGYVTNSETNAKPPMPANATNIEPPSMNSVTGNSNHSSNSSLGSNSKSNTMNANAIHK